MKVVVKQVDTVAQSQAKNSVSGLLSLTADIDFSVLPAVQNPKNALIDSSKDVFATGILDMSAIGNLNSFMAKSGITVPDITVPGSGKSNPFIQ